MERVKSVPVREPREPPRIEDSRLSNEAAGAVRLHFELKPCAARYLHLRPQTQRTIGIDRLDSPEVDGVSGDQVLGIPATAANADAPGQEVEEPSRFPEPVSPVPAGVTADATDRREGRLRIGRDLNRSGFWG